jgi:ABC-type transport system involved in multi-copper enzyme maturation permease subunit
MTRELTMTRQMIGADLLRLRKKRGFMALVLAAVLAPLVVWTGYQVIEHASNPAHYGPAGGVDHFVRMLDMLGIFMGPVAAVLIGAEAGAGDLAAGVFRDNVITGRSRWALFLARIPAALMVTFAVIGLGFAVGLAVTFGFAGGLETPSLSLILESALWLALANGVICVVAIGLATLTGSRPGTITALIGWELVLSPLLVQSKSLGSLRDGLLDGVLVFLKPGPASGAPSISMSIGVAVAVTLLWLAILPALGAWRTQTRDA